MKERRVQVDDLMQTGYRYLLTEPAGRNFHHEFRPELTPKEMLELGAPCVATSRRSETTAGKAISTVDANSAKHYSIGLTIRERFDYVYGAA